MIHDTVIIGEGVQLGEDVEIGAYSVIRDHAVIGNGCRIREHVIIRRHSILGDHVRVDSFSCVGGFPQDLKCPPGTISGIKIGNHSTLREGVTIHRSTHERGITFVGEHVFLMSGAHVAHDCVVGDHCVLANNVMLGGEVNIGHHSFIGGGSAIHQFIHVGESTMVAGMSTITRNVPHYITAANRNNACGLNMVGLERREFSQEEIADIKKCYRAVYMHDGSPAKLAKSALESNLPTTDKGRHFLKFFDDTREGKFVYSRDKSDEQG